MQVCFLLVWTMAIHYLQHIHDGEVGDLLPCFCFCFCFCFYPVSPAYTRWWSGGPPTQPVEGTSSSSHSTGSPTRWWVKFQFSSTFVFFQVYNGLSYYSANLNVSSHLGFFISSAVEVHFNTNSAEKPTWHFHFHYQKSQLSLSGSVLFPWLVGDGQVGAAVDSLWDDDDRYL